MALPGVSGSGAENLYGNASRLFARGSIHISVGNEPNAVATGGAGQNSAPLQLCDEFLGVSLVGEGDEGDIRSGSGDVDLHRRLSKPFRDPARVGVIFVQAFGPFFESDEPGGSEDARLAHAATQRFADVARAIHLVIRADEHGANRRAQSF